MLIIDKQTVISELGRRRGSWPEIARATGVSYSTITKLAQGVNTNPTSDTLAALTNHLFSPSAPDAESVAQ